ncbi:hypothetical protein HYALB_00003268 [Hymenoscyphus albidus]|uniref:Uncharacterized protein n=1 Tax=Hymenoscyphus albidus TaxID=595503 RepID=A0A9N9LD66_9HELO|nr:hypothetical protein HYALB_00003268 [Hymenoscyphus albidus]
MVDGEGGRKEKKAQRYVMCACLAGSMRGSPSAPQKEGKESEMNIPDMQSKEQRMTQFWTKSACAEQKRGED